MTRIVWHGDNVQKDAQAQAWKRVMQAAMFLKAKIQKNVDIATRAVGPSKPGEYPHKVTGTLQKSVMMYPRKPQLAVDLGTALGYGKRWETTNRPYFRRTFYEQLGTIRGILEGKITRTLEDIKAEAAEMKTRHQQQKEMIKEKKKASREAKQSKRAKAQAAKKAVKTAKKKAARTARRKQNSQRKKKG